MTLVPPEIPNTVAEKGLSQIMDRLATLIDYVRAEAVHVLCQRRGLVRVCNWSIKIQFELIETRGNRDCSVLLVPMLEHCRDLLVGGHVVPVAEWSIGEHFPWLAAIDRSDANPVFRRLSLRKCYDLINGPPNKIIYSNFEINFVFFETQVFISVLKKRFVLHAL